MLNKRAVGLDLRADGWTVLEVERYTRAGKKGLEVLNFAQGKWEPDTTPETRGEMLKAAFGRQNIARQGLVVSLPAGLGQWERPTLPELPPPLVKTALFTNLESRLSQPPEEMALAFKVQQGEEEGKTEVETFVYPQQVVACYRQILKNAGLRKVSFLPHPYGIGNYLFSFSEYLRRGGQQVFVIEISFLETEVFLFGREGIIHYRSFPSPVTPDETYNLEALAEELKLTRFLIRKQGGRVPTDARQATRATHTACATNPVFAYLSAPVSEMDKEAVGRTVAESLGLDPGRVASFSNFRPPAGLSAGEWEQPGTLAAAGLALERLGDTGCGMRLALPGEKEPPGKRGLFSWGLLLLGFFLGIGGIFFRFDALRKERAFLHEWLRNQEPELTEIYDLLVKEERLRDKIHLYSALEKERQFFFAFLSEWERVAPHGTIITHLTLENNKVGRLSGQTPSFSLFYEALLASPFFKDLQVMEGITTNSEGLEVFHLSGPVGIGKGDEQGE